MFPPLAGKPLLAHVLTAVRALQPDRVHVVCGHGGEALQEALPSQDITWVVQAAQLGTGHAVQQALPGVAPGARVLVVYGDVPMLRAKTLRTLVDRAEGAAGPAQLDLDTLPDVQAADARRPHQRLVTREHEDIDVLFLDVDG